MAAAARVVEAAGRQFPGLWLGHGPQMPQRPQKIPEELNILSLGKCFCAIFPTKKGSLELDAQFIEGGSCLGSNKEVGFNQPTCFKEIQGYINEQELDSNI